MLFRVPSMIFYFFYTFNILLGGKGDGRTDGRRCIRENKRKIEKHSAKFWVFQVILAVIVDEREVGFCF